VTLQFQSLALGRKPCTRYWKTARKSSLIESNGMWWHRNICCRRTKVCSKTLWPKSQICMWSRWFE
jgi:hypothetical protein